MPNWNDERNRFFDRDQYRSDDRRGGMYGQSLSDRFFDSNRGQDYDRSRDFGGREWGQDYNRGGMRDFARDMGREIRDWGRESMGGQGRDQNRDYGFGGYGGSVGYRGGTDYGIGRGSDYGSYGREDQQSFGGYWGRGGDQSRGYGYTGDMDNRGSSQYGRTYGQSYGSTSMNRDINYGQGGDLSNVNTMSNRGFSSLSGQFTGRGPKGWRRSDDRIKEEVCDVLERHPDIDASEIEVDVKEGMVTLRGAVDERRQKRMAEDAIEHLSGVRDVHNEIMVNRGFIAKAKEALMGESTDTTVKSGSTRTSRSSTTTSTPSPH